MTIFIRRRSRITRVRCTVYGSISHLEARTLQKHLITVYVRKIRVGNSLANKRNTPVLIFNPHIKRVA